MQTATDWPQRLNRRCWQRFEVPGLTAYVAPLGLHEGKEQIAIVVYPRGSLFLGWTDNRERDVQDLLNEIKAHYA